MRDNFWQSLQDLYIGVALYIRTYGWIDQYSGQRNRNSSRRPTGHRLLGIDLQRKAVDMNSTVDFVKELRNEKIH